MQCWYIINYETFPNFKNAKYLNSDHRNDKIQYSWSELENSLKAEMLSSLFSLNPEQQWSLVELLKAWNEMCEIWTIQKSIHSTGMISPISYWASHMYYC